MVDGSEHSMESTRLFFYAFPVSGFILLGPVLAAATIVSEIGVAIIICLALWPLRVRSNKYFDPALSELSDLIINYAMVPSL